MLFAADQSRSFNLCMAILTAPATLWAIYSAYQIYLQPQPSIPALLVRGALVYLSTNRRHSFVAKFKVAGKAQSLGCERIAVYPHKDHILGLDLFLKQIQSILKFNALIEFAERFQQYGRTHYALVLGQRLIDTDEAEVIRMVLSTRMEDWDIADSRLYSVLPLTGPKSIFSANGKEWHDARAMLRPSFVRDQVADLRLIDRHIGNLIQRIPADGSTFNIYELLLAMSMDSSTDFILGYSTGLLTDKPLPGTHEFTKAFEDAARQSAVMALAGPILFKLPFQPVERNVKKIRAFVRHYLQKVANEKDTKTAEDELKRSYVFLDELVKTGASEDYIIDQILSVLVAGRDTTALAISVCFWYLARHPDIVGKLRSEIASVDAEDPSWEQLKNMKYLNDIVKEALRLVPPIPINQRTANKDTMLPIGGGPDGKQPMLVPKGTPLRWCLYSLHRRNDIYGQDAEEFRPDRWEDDNLRPGWDYIPFHGGPRKCIGQQFALTQISYVLYRVFQRFGAIGARDEGPMKLDLGITASFPDGVLVSMSPA